MIIQKGDIIGNGYQLDQKIGKGAYGQVWKCNKNDVFFAIKIYDAPTTLFSEVQDTFNQLIKLKHENLIEVYEIGQSKFGCFLVSELIEGKTLDEFSLDFYTTTIIESITNQLIKVLNYLHTNEVLHRDLKPENMILQPNGLIKLIDFGVSTSFNYNPTNKVKLGTKSFMSPEQILGRIDKQNDIWGFGVTLYKTFTGQHPFPASTIEGLIINHYSILPASPKRLNDKIPIWVSEVIFRSMINTSSLRCENFEEIIAIKESVLKKYLPLLSSNRIWKEEKLKQAINFISRIDRLDFSSFSKYLSFFNKNRLLIITLVIGIAFFVLKSFNLFSAFIAFSVLSSISSPSFLKKLYYFINIKNVVGIFFSMLLLTVFSLYNTTWLWIISCVIMLFILFKLFLNKAINYETHLLYSYHLLSQENYYQNIKNIYRYIPSFNDNKNYKILKHYYWKLTSNRSNKGENNILNIWDWRNHNHIKKALTNDTRTINSLMEIEIDYLSILYATLKKNSAKQPETTSRIEEVLNIYSQNLPILQTFDNGLFSEATTVKRIGSNDHHLTIKTEHDYSKNAIWKNLLTHGSSNEIDINLLTDIHNFFEDYKESDTDNENNTRIRRKTRYFKSKIKFFDDYFILKRTSQTEKYINEIIPYASIMNIGFGGQSLYIKDKGFWLVEYINKSEKKDISQFLLDKHDTHKLKNLFINEEESIETIFTLKKKISLSFAFFIENIVSVFKIFMLMFGFSLFISLAIHVFANIEINFLQITFWGVVSISISYLLIRILVLSLQKGGKNKFWRQFILPKETLKMFLSTSFTNNGKKSLDDSNGLPFYPFEFIDNDFMILNKKKIDFNDINKIEIDIENLIITLSFISLKKKEKLISFEISKSMYENYIPKLMEIAQDKTFIKFS